MSSPVKILIIKSSALGDIIQAIPVLSALKRHYPDSQIDWIVEKPCADLLRGHPDIHQLLQIDTKKWRNAFWQRSTWREVASFLSQLRSCSYDFVFDLQGNIKSGLSAWAAKSSIKVGFGRSSVAEWPNLCFSSHRYNPPGGRNIRDDYLFLARMGRESAGEERPSQAARMRNNPLKVLVCPGSNWENKKLSKETLLGFLSLLQPALSCRFLFLWGNEGEKRLAEELQLSFAGISEVCDKLPLPQLRQLMFGVDLVIAMDSLPLHLAGTTSAYTYSIFGASSANKYRPTGPQHHAFQGHCPYNQQFEKRCSLLRSCATGSCMKGIQSRELFEHFMAWWIDNPAQSSQSTSCQSSQSL